MSKERVLVVDDEEGVRNSLRNILRDESYTVEVADSGERCLEMVRSAPYHAVFLDVWLPGRAREGGADAAQCGGRSEEG